MVLRKGNGRNPRVDGSARRADDRFGDDDRPLNKSYKTQTQVPTVAKHQPDQTIAAVLELLAETWPKCFSIYEARRQPLKVGVHHDILAALDGAVTAAELSRALRVYTGNKVYRSRVRPGAMRIGLDGEPSRRHLYWLPRGRRKGIAAGALAGQRQVVGQRRQFYVKQQTLSLAG
jgi:hypothetical protein